MDVVKQITREQNQNLIMPVTYDEVKCAAFAMHPDKSPGVDGLNPGFFQAYWSIVGGDVVRFCQQFFSTGELPEGINRTVVCLIPKVKQPQQMTDLRPISLCNVLFRILSKVMENRLKGCLSTVISEQQSAFVEGRLLTDNALIAFDINHYIRRRTQGTNGVVGLKLDVSKAYDRLEWNFLEAIMVKFGFYDIWRQRIITCVRSVSYSFIHEGEVFGDVQPQRGIRQGDPISPYLYILCAEGLSSMLKRHEDMGLIHGLSVARGAPSVSHLLFADDCYLFFKATAAEALTVKNLLLRYENLSGQAVNFRKSSVVFSPNTTTPTRTQVCDVLQVKEISTPGKYLGLPMHIGRRKHNAFKFLSDRVSQKLQGWGTKSISKGGKLVLLKTAAQTIPNFWMNLFLLPAEICNGIQRQMNSFWWGNGGSGKGIRWLAWDKLCNVKAGGGLGFRGLSKFNLAMLAKQGCRLLNNANPLVTSIMKARYFPETDFLQAKVGANLSYMWRSIVAAQDLVRQGSRKRIGNGDTTTVWKIPWLPCRENGYLTTEMPQQLEHARVSSLMETDTKHWDDELLRDICNERDVQLIRSIPLARQREEDSWYWILEESGLFSVKSCYRRIQGEQNWENAAFWKRIWNLELPGKVINFIWRVCRSVLPTAMALAAKRVQIDTRCSWCLVHNEDATHVLFDCSFARMVWANVGLQEVDSSGYEGSINDIFRQLVSVCTPDKLALIAMIC
ncbi:hypothetical protein DCAR_0205872 [Daucus carota subsp. sativus]|uniref:Reverse transcriptase domain-containing protein n=1 Tax=Daucus carota subsp. sativus TaxID=79200 RepID=A0AAF1ANM6_DAUCS|nr:hypothetical protein DCAR_0205872 [Daucus carota subsp. sativus]